MERRKAQPLIDFGEHDELAQTVIDHFKGRNVRELRRFAGRLMQYADLHNRQITKLHKVTMKSAEVDGYADRALAKVTENEKPPIVEESKGFFTRIWRRLKGGE